MTCDIVPQTRGWRVAIAAAGEAEPPILQVSGEIELGNTDEQPRLSPSAPQDADPTILTLDIEIITKGTSELAMHWASVEFRHPVSGAPPASVRLLWMGVEIAFLSVSD
jgi:hypothetical protein